MVSTRVDRISEVNMTALLRFDDMTNEATPWQGSSAAEAERQNIDHCGRFYGFQTSGLSSFPECPKPDGMRHIPNDAERHWMCYHAERGNHQRARAGSEPVSSRVNDTPHRQQANSHRFYVYSTIEVLNLNSAKHALAFDLHTAAAQTPQNATWVQAERRWRGVGRAAWMPRERCQDMDVRSARAHGVSPK